MQKQIANGFKLSAVITKNHAKTFYFASLFLPKEKRLAAYSVYAICRLSDNAVDTAQKSFDQLNDIRKKIALSFSGIPLADDILAAFRATIVTYKIPKQYFDDLLAGMEMDLTKNRYADFAQLNLYCYRAAGIIGLIMMKIFGVYDQRAEQYAVDLGIAMQLTNILRDINEDYAMNRIYIPQDDLLHFRLNEQIFHEKIINENFKKMISFNIQRARIYYQSAQKGIVLIPNKTYRLAVKIMAALYAEILVEIEKHSYNVFNRRARVPLWKKIIITISVLLKSLNHENKSC